jgi:hypothetical protein
MAPLQHCFLGQPDFPRQLRAGLPLQHPAHEQDDMLRGQLAAREDRATVEVIDPLAAATAIDGQPTPDIDPDQARFRLRGGAVRALQPSGMKMLL